MANNLSPKSSTVLVAVAGVILLLTPSISGSAGNNELMAGVFRNTETVCLSPNNVFHVRVDLFSSVLGHYTFEECGDVVNPTLGLKAGETYTFVQSDRSNYYHPIGVAYGPDATSEGGNIAPAVVTFRQGVLGVQQDIYERRFLEGTPIWAGYDTFSVMVSIGPGATSANSYSYHCLIHQGMEGRIQIIGQDEQEDLVNVSVNNLQKSTSTTPTKPTATISSTYEDTRSDFDKQCGTSGLEEFQLPNPLCPDRFICGTDKVTEELQDFSSCLEAANCAMMSGMTTGVQATKDSALFIHQMIPHHENAVNTAKTLLKTGNLLCPDLTDQSNPDCVLESILLAIVAGQNHQIQLMRKFLDDHQYPQQDNCDVYVKTVEDAGNDDKVPGEGGESSGSSGDDDKVSSARSATSSLMLPAMIVSLVSFGGLLLGL